MMVRRGGVRANLTALAIGTVLAVLLLGFAEVVARALDHGARLFFEPRSNDYIYMDERGVKRLRPGSYDAVARRTRDSSVIYDVTYRIDDVGRRVSRRQEDAIADSFAVFLGGSFVFGSGVEDEQTLPSQLARFDSRFTPYNYGVAGYGPYDVLARLEDDSLVSQVEEQAGVVVYVFFYGHIHRVTGAVSIIGWHRSQAHYHAGADGRPIRFRNYEAAHPWRTKIYQGLARSSLLRALSFDWPLRFSDSHLNQTAGALVAVSRAARRSLPGSRFVVVFYPGSRHVDRLRPRLEARGVEVLDYSSLFDYRRYVLSDEEQHPNTSAYEILAGQLVRDLSDR